MVRASNKLLQEVPQYLTTPLLLLAAGKCRERTRGSEGAKPGHKRLVEARAAGALS